MTSADAPVVILSALDTWLDHKSHIDILVKNAGVEVVRHLAVITPADYDKIYSLNVHAPIRLTQALLPRFNPAGRGGTASSTSGQWGREPSMRGWGFTAAPRRRWKG